MSLVDRWAILMAGFIGVVVDWWSVLISGLIGVVGRQVGYLNDRTDRCCW